ncbi:Lsr2 dimerization domain-containing protein [Nocardia colli]|uniref:Lsr2 dimerization domain-containing protein n=1 Tax=Nocardia colli TaxID=2545717 RepID=UPI0035DAF8FB
MVDDFDGESVGDETVASTIGGKAYEMDLSAANVAQLRSIFEQWIAHARAIGRVPRSARAARRSRRG